ncbi:MAG: autotransporter-associated beta strand repeat-containing protein, partial [Verrucomicrobiaceae bacterium]|nr:autotransporter-associated beta strand repeat-containing protein [Verrucomicrobiaceae bacterium]
MNSRPLYQPRQSQGSPLLCWIRKSARVPLTALLLACFASWSVQSHAATGTWTLNNNGTWTNTANWSGGLVPNAIGDVALFNQVNLTGNRTVTLDVPVTLGGLVVGDTLGANTYTFSGSGLTMQALSGNAFINKYNSTTDILQAPLTLNSHLDANIYTGTFQIGPSATVPLISASSNFIKNGMGAVQLNVDGTGFNGNWVANRGTLTIAGNNGSADPMLGTGSIIINGTGRTDLTTVNIANNSTGSLTTVTYPGTNNVISSGAATLAAIRHFISGANDNVTHVLDGLTVNGGIFRANSGNGHSLQFAGPINILGQTSVFDVLGNATATRATLILGGAIDDGVATRNLIKEGAGRLRIISNANTYGGITSIKDGVVQLDDGANLGGGSTFVNGGLLSVATASTINNLVTTSGVTLVGQLGTSRFAIPAIGYSGSDAIDATRPINVSVPVAGMALAIDGVTGTASTNAANIDMAYVAGGSNRVWLSNVPGFDRTYTGTLTNGASGDLRLVAAANNLILSAADQLGGAAGTNNLVFGYDHSNPIVFTGNHIGQATGLLSGTTAGNGIVSVRANNAATLGTVTVNRGVTLNINGAGLTRPVGQGAVVALGGTLSTDNATDAKFGNTDFKLFGGSTLLLDNSAVVVDNTDRRLLPTSTVSLSSSTLRLIGDGGAVVLANQTLQDLLYRGGSVLSIDTDGTTVGRKTTLTASSFTRQDRGTLILKNIQNTATTFGTSAATQRLIIGTSPIPANGMIGANIVLWGGANSNDASLPLFVTHDGTDGVQAATMTTLANAGALALETAGTTIGDISGLAIAVTGSPSLQALRIRSTATGNAVTGGTITLGAAAGVGQGAGLFLAHTSNDTVTHTTNFSFAGGQEGLLYVATSAYNAAATPPANNPNNASGIVSLNGVLSGTAGVTRFGDGVLVLGGANTFTGPLTINSGETRLNNLAAAGGTPTTPGQIDINGGSTYLNATGRYYTNITARENSRLGNVNVGSSGFNNLTIAPRSGSSAPVILWVQNQAGGNITTAYGTLDMAANGQLSVVHPLQVNGGITGSGNIEKFMNERLIVAGDSSGYSGNITAYAGVLQSYTASPTAKPFGSANTITINPGAHLILAAPSNVNNGQVTINSDHGGIATIGQLYVADPATTLPTMSINSSAPWKVAFAIGAVGFSQDINQSTLFGGNTYLGAALGYTGIYTGNL